MKHCKYCGQELRDGAKFCSSCGKKVEDNIEQTKYCDECGAKIGINDLYCSACGYKFQPTIVAPSQAPKKYIPEPSRGLDIRNNTLYGIGNCRDIDIIIPDYVTSIADGAFKNYDSLRSLLIPKSVKHIGKSILIGCKNIPLGLGGIEVDKDNPYFYSVNNCVIDKQTKHLIVWCYSSIVPKDILGIGECALGGRSDLYRFDIPDGVTYIGEHAFSSCPNLSEIHLPNSITHIGKGAFYGCYNLQSISLPDSLKIIEENTFYFCSSLKTIKIPESTTQIGRYAFLACDNLSSIIISKSVIDIGEEAFHCKNLKTIIVDPDNPKYYSENNCLIEKETKKLIVCADPNNIPDDIKILGDCMLNKSNITALSLPSALIEIGNHAFNCIYNLSSVTIPNNLKKIGSSAFANTNISSISIPKETISIGSGSFSNCSNLKTIIVDPDNPKYYSENNCLIEKETKKLVACTDPNCVPNDIKIIGDKVFDSIKLQTINIPEGVTVIGEFAFCMCKAETIALPQSLITISDNAFRSCSNLTKIVLPKNLKDIGEYAFSGCNELEHIIIPKSVENIDENAFAYCNNLKTLTIPKHTHIGDHIHQGCGNFERIIWV